MALDGLHLRGFLHWAALTFSLSLFGMLYNFCTFTFTLFCQSRESIDTPFPSFADHFIHSSISSFTRCISSRNRAITLRIESHYIDRFRPCLIVSTRQRSINTKSIPQHLFFQLFNRDSKTPCELCLRRSLDEATVIQVRCGADRLHGVFYLQLCGGGFGRGDGVDGVDWGADCVDGGSGRWLGRCLRGGVGVMRKSATV
ncbi:hypothetical protein K458DRAFT_113893 [Lentithecium fluviatile CBS 122367]|uniref:Uncharacterized protein n=1 Tax=Lentithecium fluviatile CBS 122367 TaxID=1168545 RepID=A0A6G1INE6_9PLEO|nr:hypothetical protein K458DRAFT_113893 [Lentithecium fluviatile CBS 122367]